MSTLRTSYLGAAEHTPIYGVDTPILGGKVHERGASVDLGLRRDVLLLIAHVGTALRTGYTREVSCQSAYVCDQYCIHALQDSS